MTADNPAYPESVLDLFRLDGRVAVVTGGGSGIGRMACHVLAEAGAIAWVTDIDPAKAEAVAGEVRERGFKAEAHGLDVAREASVVAAMDVIDRAHGRIDVLVNNAGINRRGPTLELGLDAWNEVVAVNLTGVFLCAREAGRRMVRQQRGSIVNLASIYGHVASGFAPAAPYAATKAGVVNLTRALANEWGPMGVRVNAIAPTFIETDLTRQAVFAQPEVVKLIRSRMALGRTGVPADLAGAVLYLASDASALVTGHSLAVDGGWLAQ